MNEAPRLVVYAVEVLIRSTAVCSAGAGTRSRSRGRTLWRSNACLEHSVI
jgi:hypothetical protein